jgi:hypothetical protein
MTVELSMALLAQMLIQLTVLFVLCNLPWLDGICVPPHLISYYTVNTIGSRNEVSVECRAVLAVHCNALRSVLNLLDLLANSDLRFVPKVTVEGFKNELTV